MKKLIILSEALRMNGGKENSDIIDKVIPSFFDPEGSENLSEIIYLQEEIDNKNMHPAEKEMLSLKGYTLKDCPEWMDDGPIRLSYRDILITRLKERVFGCFDYNGSNDKVVEAFYRVFALESDEGEFSEGLIREVLYTDKFYDFFGIKPIDNKKDG